MKTTEELTWLNEVSCVPLQQAIRHQQAAYAAFFAKRARYPRFKSRNGRQSAEYTRSGFRWRDGAPVPGEDGHAAGVHLVLARHRPRLDRPDDGDGVPGPVRTLVRLVRRRRTRTRAAPRRRPGRRGGPGDQGLRGHQRRAADPQPAAPGTPGPEPGPLPAADGPLPARVRATAPKPRPRPPARTARSAPPAPTSSTRPAPAWSATTT